METIKRIFRVEREHPRSNHSLRIHQEVFVMEGDEEIAHKQNCFVFDEPMSKVATMAATKQYLEDVGAVTTLEGALAAEDIWYESLIAERNAEKEAEAEAQRKAEENSEI